MCRSAMAKPHSSSIAAARREAFIIPGNKNKTTHIVSAEMPGDWSQWTLLCGHVGCEGNGRWRVRRPYLDVGEFPQRAGRAPGYAGCRGRIHYRPRLLLPLLHSSRLSKGRLDEVVPNDCSASPALQMRVRRFPAGKLLPSVLLGYALHASPAQGQAPRSSGWLAIWLAGGVGGPWQEAYARPIHQMPPTHLSGWAPGSSRLYQGAKTE